MYPSFLILLCSFLFFTFSPLLAKKNCPQKGCSPCPTLPKSYQIRAQEVALINLVNQERSKKNLDPLKEVPLLSQIAKKHSISMACSQSGFGHSGFDQRMMQIKGLGTYKSAGENVGYTAHVANPNVMIVDMWMRSASHRANILDSYHMTGIGIAYSQNGNCYIVQVFAQKI